MSDHPETPTSEAHHGHGSLLARVVWAMFGPLVLLSLLFFVGQSRLNIWDLFYWLNVIAMIVARIIEFRTGMGTDLYGEALTAKSNRNYAIRLFAVALIFSAAAKMARAYLA